MEVLSRPCTKMERRVATISVCTSTSLATLNITCRTNGTAWATGERCLASCRVRRKLPGKVGLGRAHTLVTGTTEEPPLVTYRWKNASCTPNKHHMSASAPSQATGGIHAAHRSGEYDNQHVLTLIPDDMRAGIVLFCSPQRGSAR